MRYQNRLTHHRNHISLWRFAEVLGINPDFFGCDACLDGVDVDFDAEVKDCCSGCRNNDNCIPRWDWSNDRWLSIEEIFQAIDQATDEIATFCGYFPYPAYFSYEQEYPRDRVGTTTLYHESYKRFRMDQGYFIKAGMPVVTEIAVDQPITITNRFWEFSITVLEDPTDTEFMVAHTETNREGEPVEDWTLDGVKISIVETVADTEWTITFRGRQWQLTDPQYALAGECCTWDRPYDPLVPFTFTCADCHVDQLSVYQIVQDPCQQGLFTWKNRNGCNQKCSTEQKPFCTVCWDKRRSWIELQPYECCDTTGDGLVDALCSYCFSTLPIKAETYYRAGMPLNNDGTMNKDLERAIIYLAASYLSCSPPTCQCTNKCIYAHLKYWKAPYQFKLQEGDSETYVGDVHRILLPQKKLEAYPFTGMTNGGVAAWNIVRKYKLGDR